VTPYELKETLVTIRDASLKFGEKTILRPTSVEVKDIVRPGMIQGQVVGILGPSGIGKTQFSRIIAGLQAPTTGTVEILNYYEGHNNVSPQMLPTEPGRVGFVFQKYPLFEHRTVLGNLLVALERSGLTPKDRAAKAREYLHNFQLQEREDFYPAQLSGGQRQRVAIIQSLLCSEHYMVMDEPFTGLDPLMKDRVCELINKVATLHEHNTIFVVAHDIAALVTISDCLWLFGREPNIPGATIKATYNLIERGLAWKPDISSTREFSDFVNEIKAEFKNL